MSTMKDYMMWLDDKGIAKWDNTLGELIIPNDVSVYTNELIEQYKNDAKWHCPNDDDLNEDDDDDEDEFFEDDNDLGDMCEWSSCDSWVDTNGGLTGPSMDFLHNLDMNGELI